ncbi:MAG: glycosyltransferase involved in cell wall biosynthesis [Motiliproteus sp.]|jgi:glycosyltransferase involved in cell wall biosynthesis
MTRVLIIGYVWPEPDSSAAGSRMLQLIQLFRKQGWQVTFASPAVESEQGADLHSRGVEKVGIRLNSSCFDSFVRQCAPDIVIFDRFMMEEQFGWRVEKNCPQALRILDTVDLHCLRDARHQALKQGRALAQHDLVSDLALREVASILRCDLALMISAVEMTLLQERFKVAPEQLHHCRFMLPGLDQAAQRDWPDFAQRQHFITIGNFRHAPNWDAVLYLKQSLWPLIRQQLPKAELHIYGAYPPPKAIQLHNDKQGFKLLGWARDGDAVMRSARVCLAPLRFGAGIKGKLVQAMQCGTPSVTTEIGAEAMHDDLPWSGRVADDPQAFVDQAVRLYQDQPLWQQCQARGVAIINQCYDQELIGADLLERLAQLRQQLDQQRLNNFTGAMLRHHSMKSHQYMSQWIEAKNRLPE